MVYTLRFFFFSKCSLFHNSTVFGFCIIHILYTGVLKLKKEFQCQKVKVHENKINVQIATSFLGAFAKWRKATVSYVMSVHLSVPIEQLGFHWTDFHEI